VAGRLLRLLGGAAVAASAALPCLHDDAGHPVSPLRLLLDRPSAAVVVGALITFALPYLFGAFLAVSSLWALPRAGRRRGMLSVAFAVLATLGAGLAGLVLVAGPGGHRLVGLLLLAVAGLGLLRLRNRLTDESGDLAGMARGALRIGSVVVAVWFVVLYVDESLVGPLLGLAGVLVGLVGLSLDDVPPLVPAAGPPD
jgi:hypothetical protein